jgi:hypothetical protein
MVTKKMCDINKNVTKMGVIIKGIYCNRYTKHVWGANTTNFHKNPLYELCQIFCFFVANRRKFENKNKT